MKILFIIPARKGSKRLPGKNTMLFDGKPLISHTIDFALAVSDNGDNVCVTTDDEEILALACHNSVSLIIRRPAELASDSATSLEVIIHAIESAMDRNLSFDTIVLLQPTTPFRSPADFKKMKREFQRKKMSFYTSISLSRGEVKNRIFYDRKSFRASKKKNRSVGYLNGSIYVMSAEYIRDERTLNYNDSYFFIMSDKNSIDIDTKEDWITAEKFL